MQRENGHRLKAIHTIYIEISLFWSFSEIKVGRSGRTVKTTIRLVRKKLIKLGGTTKMSAISSYVVGELAFLMEITKD